jgi:hypothetical protein
MGNGTFFSELKRRQIYRGGVMYVVAGWVIVQVATTLFPIFNIPEWAIRLIVVALMLGFPLALVALWMFESHGSRNGKPADASDVPAAPAFERRRGGDRSGDALARLVESERAERQRTNEELLAALERMKGSPNAPATMAQPAPMPGHAPVSPPRRRPRIGTILLTVFVTILAAWGIWILVAPSTVAPVVGDASQVTSEYVVPAYRQAEQVGAALLQPLLRKLGIGLPAERVFTALMLLIALLVLRNLYRSMLASRRLRHHPSR